MYTRAGVNMQQERWLSVDEMAAHLGLNPDTVYKWIERKKLPAHKLGRLWKFQVSEVNDIVCRFQNCLGGGTANGRE